MNKMTRALSTATLVLFGLGLGACSQEGPAERAGEKIDNAVEETGESIDSALENAGDKIEDAADKVEDKMEEKAH